MLTAIWDLIGTSCVREAQTMALGPSCNDITPSGMVNGVQVDLVTYLLTQLAASFAPVGEEARLAAMSELMSFHRQQGETTDPLISRFWLLKWRAAQGNTGINMT